MLRAIGLRIPFLIALGTWLTAFVVWCAAPIRTISPTELSNLTESGRKYFHPDYDLPIYLAAGLFAVLVSAVFQRKGGTVGSGIELSTELSASPESDARLVSRWLGWSEVIAILIVIAFVAVISPGKLMERAYACDGFHHVDFYVMGPLQAVLHGKAIGTDAFSQYGGGWVLVYALIEQFQHVDHTLFFATFPIFGLIYYLVAYLALRQLTGDRWWSLLGLLIGILLTMYCGNGIPRWVTPSSTVLRCPLDMLLAIAILNIDRQRGRWWAIIAGIAAGMSVLFGVDTGIYLLAGIVVVSVLMVLQSIASRNDRPVKTLLWIWGACILSAAFGLILVSRGTLTRREFWVGYFEALWAYGSGFSALPLSNVILHQPLDAIVFLVVLLIYSLTLSVSISRALSGESKPQDLMRAFLATVGFGTLMVFVNRSMPYNLYYPILPACCLITAILADTYPLQGPVESPGRKTYRRLASLFTVGILLALLLNRNVRDYPSVIGESIAWIRSYPTSPPAVPELTHEIREIAEALKHQNPDHELIVIGEDPTLWLLTLNLSPVGRYCPATPITQTQSDRIRRDVLESGAQSIVVTRVPNSGDIGGNSTLIEEIVSIDFELQESKPLYAVYVRRSQIDLKRVEGPEGSQ